MPPKARMLLQEQLENLRSEAEQLRADAGDGDSSGVDLFKWED
jgi:hypothetical protein